MHLPKELSLSQFIVERASGMLASLQLSFEEAPTILYKFKGNLQWYHLSVKTLLTEGGLEENCTLGEFPPHLSNEY